MRSVPGARAALSLFAASLVLAAAPGLAQTDASLAQRVQHLEDEREIREVLVLYGEYLDARDYAGYASLFARNGVWVGGFGSATGPAEIEAMLVEQLGAAEPGFVNTNSFHQMTTMVVDVDGDTAKARSRYMFFTATSEGRPSPLLAGRYEDHFVREDDAWKISRRITHGVIPFRDGNDPAPAAVLPGLSQGR
jgi:ketosteroid isomerase-like protein